MALHLHKQSILLKKSSKTRLRQTDLRQTCEAGHVDEPSFGPAQQRQKGLGHSHRRQEVDLQQTAVDGHGLNLCVDGTQEEPGVVHQTPQT